MFWLVGSACYSPTATPGAPCAPVGIPVRCPTGLVCVDQGGVDLCVLPGVTDAGKSPVDGSDGPSDGPSDAPKDAAATTDAPKDAAATTDAPRDAAASDAAADAANPDLDGDGVPNALDNCPTVSNPDQANEDGDAFGDACDLCPPFPDLGEDVDGDGVGDLCDPAPTIPGDKIVVFWGFHSGLPAGATVTGNVTAASGDATVVASGSTALLTIAVPATQHEDVWAEATLDVDGGGAIMGVVDEHQATDNGISCQLNVGGSPVLRLFDSNAGNSLSSSGHAFALSTRYQLHVRRDLTAYKCNATSPTLQITGSSTFAPAAAEVGIRLRTGTARYHWVMVTSSP